MSKFSGDGVELLTKVAGTPGTRKQGRQLAITTTLVAPEQVDALLTAIEAAYPSLERNDQAIRASMNPVDGKPNVVAAGRNREGNFVVYRYNEKRGGHSVVWAGLKPVEAVAVEA